MNHRGSVNYERACATISRWLISYSGEISFSVYRNKVDRAIVERVPHTSPTRARTFVRGHMEPCIVGREVRKGDSIFIPLRHADRALKEKNREVHGLIKQRAKKRRDGWLDVLTWHSDSWFPGKTRYGREEVMLEIQFMYPS